MFMNAEKEMGKYLAQESSIKADIVIHDSNSGVPAALGYAKVKNSIWTWNYKKSLCQ